MLVPDHEENVLPDHYQKLKRLTQRTCRIDDYYQEIEMLMIRAYNSEVWTVKSKTDQREMQQYVVNHKFCM